MIIARTPFRISFFGGGTDYPAWYLKHGGAVLATTIDKYCYLTCRFLPPFFEHRIRIVYSKVENCQTVDEIAHPAVREILRYLDIERGVEIHHDGDLPARSGMGSSSSFTVGLLHALHALKGRMPDKRQLAQEGIYIERTRLKETVGSQDQVMAAYGGFNHITFPADGEFIVRPVTIGADRLRELNDHLLLAYTGIARTASQVAEGCVQGMERNEANLQMLRDIVDEGISILARGEDIMRFGRLLHESWRAKRSLSAMVTNSDIEALYDAALSAGAVGGKITGAGGGGFLLLFVPPSRRERVRGRLKHLIHVPFKFTQWGSQVILVDREEDYLQEELARAAGPRPVFREFVYERVKDADGASRPAGASQPRRRSEKVIAKQDGVARPA